MDSDQKKLEKKTKFDGRHRFRLMSRSAQIVRDEASEYQFVFSLLMDVKLQEMITELFFCDRHRFIVRLLEITSDWLTDWLTNWIEFLFLRIVICTFYCHFEIGIHTEMETTTGNGTYWLWLMTRLLISKYSRTCNCARCKMSNDTLTLSFTCCHIHNLKIESLCHCRFFSIKLSVFPVSQNT